MAKKPEEPIDHLLGQMKAVAPVIKLAGVFFPKIKRSFAKLSESARELEVTRSHFQKFRNTYTEQGWCMYDSFSTRLAAERN